MILLLEGLVFIGVRRYERLIPAFPFHTFFSNFEVYFFIVSKLRLALLTLVRVSFDFWLRFTSLKFRFSALELLVNAGGLAIELSSFLRKNLLQEKEHQNEETPLSFLSLFASDFACDLRA